VQRVGRGVGGVFAFSTLGSLAGALLAGFVLVPLFSLDFIFTSVGATLIALSALGLLCFESPGQGPTGMRRRWRFLSLLFLLILPATLLPKLRVGSDFPGVEVGHHTHSRYADLKVLNLGGGRLRCLVADGSVQSCTHLHRGVSDFYYIPEAARLIRERRRAKGGDEFRILLLGLGAGSLVRVIPSDVHLDIVEMDEGVVELGREHFGFELRAKQTLFIDDARRFLRTTTQRYDVIMCDVLVGSEPPFHLFAREFFELMAGRLEADGLGLLLFASQPWSGSRYTTSIVKTAASVFDVVLLTSPFGSGETRRSDDLLLHLATDRFYRFPSSLMSRYGVVAIDHRGGVVATDAHNPIAEFGFEERANRRREMLRLYGGYAALFSR
jgi:spermidine synthase